MNTDTLSDESIKDVRLKLMMIDIEAEIASIKSPQSDTNPQILMKNCLRNELIEQSTGLTTQKRAKSQF